MKYFHLKLPLFLLMFLVLLSVCASGSHALTPTRVNGTWGNWTDWSPCSATCGEGTKTRTRKCDSPAPSHDGKNCSGDSKETSNCSVPSCPAVSGTWGNWTDWSPCSATCGEGTKARTRKCDSPAPSRGGKNCSGDSKETSSCGVPSCPTVNGTWGNWTNWSPCSATCGEGTKARTRKCDSPAPSHGGKNCSGDSKETSNCSVPSCPTENPKPTSPPDVPNTDFNIPKNGANVTLLLAIEADYKPDLKNRSSELYKNISEIMKETLENKFVNGTGLGKGDVNVTINGFSKGSLIVNYTVHIRKKIKNDKDLIKLHDVVEQAATKWSTFEVPIGKVLDNETKQINVQNMRSLIQHSCHCPREEDICAVENDELKCIHKCKNETMCGSYGTCVFDIHNKPVCRCKLDDNEIYYGEFCGQNRPKISFTKPPSPTSDAISLSKMTIIAIASGVAGGLLLILLITIACFCYRTQNGKRHRSYSDTSSKCDSDVVRANNKMENIPLESSKINAFYEHDGEEIGFRYNSEPEHKSSRTNPLFQEDREDVHTRYHPEPRREHDRVSRGSMNFQTSSDRPRTQSMEGYGQPMKTNYYNEAGEPYRRNFQSSQQSGHESDYRRQNRRNDVNDQRKISGETSLNEDRYVYIEAKPGDRRMYKKVEDEGLGGSTLIYQPSNMPRPIQRENVESVGDNFSLRPAPGYTERQRSASYDSLDTEKPYKIQRPNIKHNNLYS